MKTENWDKIKYLPISSFILITIVFLINIYFLSKLFISLKQLTKFQSQEVAYYQNQKKCIFLKMMFVGLIGIYLVNLGLFISYLTLFLHSLNNNLLVIYYLDETFILIFLGIAIYFLIWTTQNNSALIIVIKNQKLILLNETILLEDIIKVFHDEKRKYIYIRWKDHEVKGNTGQVKIRYHYQIKDLFMANQLPTFFD